MKTLTFGLGLNLACVAGACLNITPNFCLNIFSISLGTLDNRLPKNWRQRLYIILETQSKEYSGFFLIGPK